MLWQDTNGYLSGFEEVSRTENARPTRTAWYVKWAISSDQIIAASTTQAWDYASIAELNFRCINYLLAVIVLVHF